MPKLDGAELVGMRGTLRLVMVTTGLDAEAELTDLLHAADKAGPVLERQVFCFVKVLHS